MRKLITGVVIGFLLSAGAAYGFRMAKPVPIQKLDDASLTQLNQILEDLWTITDGRYSLNVVTSIPTTSASTGEIRVYYSGSTYRLYVYFDGAWRYITFDG